MIRSAPSQDRELEAFDVDLHQRVTVVGAEDTRRASMQGTATPFGSGSAVIDTPPKLPTAE